MTREPDALLLSLLETLRRSLNHFPEAAGHEDNTARVLAGFLGAYQPDRLLCDIGGYGMAAVYQGSEPGPTVMIRSDMDAVPSETDKKTMSMPRGFGVAHRCGHDGHMAMVAGLAALFHFHPPPCGRVVLLFQPAEETGQGACRMMDDPKWNEIRPDYAVALHNLPGFERGTVVYRRGVFASASVGMKIALFGQPSHAAEPEAGRSPAPALSQLMTELPTLGQRDDDNYTMLTVTHARLGRESFGVSPGKAALFATLRATTGQPLSDLQLRAIQRVQHLAADHGLRAEETWVEEFPETRNSDELVDLLTEVCQQLDVTSQEIAEPMRWSDDFGHFARVYPSLYFGLGIGRDAPALHRFDYEFPDQVIATGLSVFHAITLGLLAPGEKLATDLSHVA